MQDKQTIGSTEEGERWGIGCWGWCHDKSCFVAHFITSDSLFGIKQSMLPCLLIHLLANGVFFIELQNRWGVSGAKHLGGVGQ